MKSMSYFLGHPKISDLLDAHHEPQQCRITGLDLLEYPIFFPDRWLILTIAGAT